MTIGYLIKLLQKFPPEKDIYMSEDSEGNGYRGIDGVYSHESETENEPYLVLYPNDEIVDL